MTANPNYLGIEGAAYRSEGLIWNQLHFEREDICDALCKQSATTNGILNKDERQDAYWHTELLYGRLRKVDDALDRLMSGSYGNCCKCDKPIEETKLEFDAAVAFCSDCWQREQDKMRLDRLTSPKMQATSPRNSSHQGDERIELDALKPFDTLYVQTRNSEYRIFMLDPKNGRALIVGGRHFVEPMEATVIGSLIEGSTFRVGWIGIGQRIEFWFDDKVARTSPVESFHIEHQVTANSECSSLAS